jgi:hypothetical protein
MLLVEQWLTDPAQRAKLVSALTPLFAHYASNPRNLSWEIYNEPEFQIWNNEIDESSVVTTAKDITTAIHQNSQALVTVGNAFADGIPMWKDVGLDYYSPHWYDYMNSGTYCLRCNDYNFYKTKYGITQPIVVGETYTSPTTDSLVRYTDFYNKGYAGAWSWSLFYNNTNDKLQVDFSTMKTFTSSHTDIGPNASGLSTQPSPTVTPTVTPIPSAATPRPFLTFVSN